MGRGQYGWIWKRGWVWSGQGGGGERRCWWQWWRRRWLWWWCWAFGILQVLLCLQFWPGFLLVFFLAFWPREIDVSGEADVFGIWEQVQWNKPGGKVLSWTTCHATHQLLSSTACPATYQLLRWTACSSCNTMAYHKIPIYKTRTGRKVSLKSDWPMIKLVPVEENRINSNSAWLDKIFKSTCNLVQSKIKLDF